MIARISRLVAASSLALLAAPASWEKSITSRDGMGSPATDERGYQPLFAEVHIGWTLNSLAVASVSRNGMDVYEVKFGHGCVDLEVASLGPDGTARFHSFRMHY
jgi:hypothetical protein